jgi:hypothetical protein
MKLVSANKKIKAVEDDFKIRVTLISLVDASGSCLLSYRKYG